MAQKCEVQASVYHHRARVVKGRIRANSEEICRNRRKPNQRKLLARRGITRALRGITHSVLHESAPLKLPQAAVHWKHRHPQAYGSTYADGINTLPQITVVSQCALGIFSRQSVLVPWKLQYPRRRSARLRGPTTVVPVGIMARAVALGFEPG